MKRCSVRFGVGIALLTMALAAHAGRSCEAKRPDAVAVQRAMTLAQHVAQRLDASGADVVVLGRVGQDLRKYGQRYSHMGLAYRDGTTWRVVHKLNQCGSARAELYRQGLGEFFLDDLFDFQAGIVVLAPPVQSRLLPALHDNRRVAQLHTAAYSMVAYPWAQTYQQSNQWALETLAMTQDPAATTRERAQAWLRLQGYQPATLHLSAVTRLGARMTAANVAFDDHPNERRFTDRIDTVTVDSVFTWLQRSGLGTSVITVR
jgi:hypothetical protein